MTLKPKYGPQTISNDPYVLNLGSCAACHHLIAWNTIKRKFECQCKVKSVKHETKKNKTKVKKDKSI